MTAALAGVDEVRAGEHDAADRANELNNGVSELPRLVARTWSGVATWRAEMPAEPGGCVAGAASVAAAATVVTREESEPCCEGGWS